jgi:hypothetical protein
MVRNRDFGEKKYPPTAALTDCPNIDISIP